MVYGSPAVRADGSGRKYPGGASANHWKRWDAKPEASGRSDPYPRSFGCTANHGKPWDAKLWGLRGSGSGGVPLSSFREERT